MAHKTLIGGTAYEISGGKPLVNGTAYSIDKGKALVDGTAYEVGFAPKTVDIELIGFTTQTCYITYNGVKYNNSCTITANVGDIIHMFIEDVVNYGYGAYVYRKTPEIYEILAEVHYGKTTYDYVVVPTTTEIMMYDEHGGGIITISET